MTVEQPPKVDTRVLRILVVEDEVLLAMQIEDVLLEMGHEVVGPTARILEALDFARHATLDFAILDVNIAGSQSFPVADILIAREIPFTFATGYGKEGILDEYCRHPVLSKPYQASDLRLAVEQIL